MVQDFYHIGRAFRLHRDAMEKVMAAVSKYITGGAAIAAEMPDLLERMESSHIAFMKMAREVIKE